MEPTEESISRSKSLCVIIQAHHRQLQGFAWQASQWKAALPTPDLFITNALQFSGESYHQGNPPLLHPSEPAMFIHISVYTHLAQAFLFRGPLIRGLGWGTSDTSTNHITGTRLRHFLHDTWHHSLVTNKARIRNQVYLTSSIFHHFLEHTWDPIIFQTSYQHVKELSELKHICKMPRIVTVP